MSTWKEESNERHQYEVKRQGKFEREARKKRFRARASNTAALVTTAGVFLAIAITAFLQTSSTWTTEHCFRYNPFTGQARSLLNCGGNSQPTIFMVLLSLFFATMATIALVGLALSIVGLGKILIGKKDGLEAMIDGLPMVFIGLLGSFMLTLALIMTATT